MLARHLRSSTFVVAALPLLFAACKLEGGNGGYTKDEARALGGVDDDGNDICALEGWYGDSVCDTFCVEQDPDCPVSNCPDPNDPRVTYRGGPGEIVCAQEIDFCGPDQATFNSPECGCGCIDTTPGKVCGGFTAGECGPGEFCDFPLEAVCGAADQSGTCAPIPDACPEYYSPVCGCDGQTYGNECEANASGTSIVHAGACDPQGQFCGGIAGTQCGEGYFCNMDFECSIEDAGGVCEPLPQGCPDIWAPVCSCDGVTYSSACDAHAQGAAVAFEGTCEDPAILCGGDIGETCQPDEFCAFTIQDMCGWADAAGVCTPVPTACPDNVDPVCGCDGVTYSNECEANAAGTAIVSFGECVLVD